MNTHPKGEEENPFELQGAGKEKGSLTKMRGRLEMGVSRGKNKCYKTCVYVYKYICMCVCTHTHLTSAVQGLREFKTGKDLCQGRPTGKVQAKYSS